MAEVEFSDSVNYKRQVVPQLWVVSWLVIDFFTLSSIVFVIFHNDESGIF